MILVDTSVWIDHLRNGDPALVALLNRGQALSHPFILGEIALGSLRHRRTVLGTLANLHQVTVATDDEVLGSIDRWSLAGNGIGYVDSHLLAAIALSPGTLLWTRDKRLNAVATGLNFHAPLS